MAKDTLTYYFGRLNIAAAFPTNKYEFLKATFRTEEVLDRYGHSWGFFNIAELMEPQMGAFFTGYLAKFKDKHDEEKVNVDLHQIETEIAEDRVRAKSRFFLHVKSGLIAFHPVGEQISDRQFRSRFAELVKHANGDFFIDAEIVSIESRGSFFELLRGFSSVRHLNIWLHPSNPSNADAWQAIDQRLKKLHAHRYNERYALREGLVGSTLAEDPDIVGKVTMAEDGYGVAVATGKKDGKLAYASTQDNYVTAESLSDKADSNSVFSRLIGTFEDIGRRFNHSPGSEPERPVI